jgi:glycosyltransferase involved in cell wall biosynthesis
MIPFQENFHSYLKQSDLMIVNSNYEGLNNMIIHSLACGIPIISRDCPSGPSEILQNGKFGHLVALGDDKKMIELIKQEMKKSSFNSQKLIERSSAFSVSKAASEYNKVFLKCLNVDN